MQKRKQPELQSIAQLTRHSEQSGDGRQLTGLIHQAEAYRQLEQGLYRHFPEWPQDCVRLACIKDQQAILLCANASWASRLRWQQAQIVTACKAILQEAGSNQRVSQTVIKVRNVGRNP